MNTKQTKSGHTSLERTLTLAGLAVIIIGCVANLYGTYLNQRFIQDPFDLLYYFRYIILLGGGFAAGYLLTKKSGKQSRQNTLFLGVVYSLLIVAVFMLFDTARAGLEATFGQFPYPWGKIVFMSIPLLAVLTGSIIAYLSQYAPNRASASLFAKLTVVFSFILYQVYMLVSGIYYLVRGASTHEPATPLWFIIGSYLISPLVVAIIAYLVLTKERRRFDRSFYAALIGLLYSVLAFVLWEFRTEASYDATNNFSAMITVISLIFVGAVLWRAR